MHGVFKALVNGLQEKGEGRVLWVRGETCSYCCPEDFGNAEFASGLRMLLDKPQAQTLFFVVNEEGGKLHVVAYPREKVYREYEEEFRRVKMLEEEEGKGPCIEEEGESDALATETKSESGEESKILVESEAEKTQE